MAEDTNGDDRNRMPCRNELLDACARHTLSEQDVKEIAKEGKEKGQIVIREAYIPYIPPQWNGYLVLAESQNLANTKDVQNPKILTSQEQMNRFSDGPAVGPWNDGSLPCAIEAAFPLNSCKIAVSNAVPWSQTTPDGKRNLTPSKTMKNKAVRFWENLLPLLKPKLTHIITAGNVAKEVLKRAAPEGHYCLKSVRLPSPKAMSLISGMFKEEDLLRRYPEVQKVDRERPEWFQTHNRQTRQNKVFFACHVVSLYGQNDG